MQLVSSPKTYTFSPLLGECRDSPLTNKYFFQKVIPRFPFSESVQKTVQFMKEITWLPKSGCEVTKTHITNIYQSKFRFLGTRGQKVLYLLGGARAW